jgi:predicted dehydrogenase
MADRLRVGIVGASGWMAGALAAGVEHDPDGGSVVTALCDLDRAAMAERQRTLGLKHATLHTDYAAMLAADEVDAVVVAVPNHLHAKFALMALAAGKHLFLEKPFATTVADARRLLAAAQDTRAVTKVDYLMMHEDEQVKLRRLARDGAFGAIASAYFSYRHPINVSTSPGQAWKLSREKSGGALAMGICHVIACMVGIIDDEPVSVICKSSPARLRSFDYHTQHDIVVAFSRGAVGVVQGNIDFAEKFDVRHSVIGTAGQFDYLPQNPPESRAMWSSAPLGRAYGPDPGFAQGQLDSGDVWGQKCAATIQDFVANARARRPDPLLGLASPTVRRIEAIIWAAEASAAAGSVPVDPSRILDPIDDKETPA